MKDIYIKKKKSFPVKDFFNQWGKPLKLKLETPEDSLGTLITDVAIHRPGLALAGFDQVFTYHRIQVIGNSEWTFLESAGSSKREEIFNNLVKYPSPLWVLTNGNQPHVELLTMCKEQKVPLVTTPIATLDLLVTIQRALDDWFLPACTVHGTLVDVYGVGMLYTGKSGVGKSECALDLVERGHRLVADDVVNLVKSGNNIIGKGSETLGHHMEIRGVGIVDVGMLFGIRAIRDKKKVEIVVDLQHWRRGEHYDRTGLEEITTEIMGVPIPQKIIPISPGKNITVISEVIAMNMLLKMNKVDVAKMFNERLMNRIRTKSKGNSIASEISSTEVYE